MPCPRTRTHTWTLLTALQMECHVWCRHKISPVRPSWTDGFRLAAQQVYSKRRADGGVASIPAHGLVARHRQALLAAGSLTLTRSAFVRATSNDRRWLHVVDWILRTGWPTRTRDHALATRVFDAWWQAPMPHEPIPTWPHRKTWCKALRKAFGSVHNSEASKLLCVLFIAVFEAHIRSRWADDTSHWRMNRAPPA